MSTWHWSRQNVRGPQENSFAGRMFVTSRLKRRASHVKMNKLFFLNLFLHIASKFISLRFFNIILVTLSLKKS